jgi:hypothetical protein
MRTNHPSNKLSMKGHHHVNLFQDHHLLRHLHQPRCQQYAR